MPPIYSFLPFDEQIDYGHAATGEAFRHASNELAEARSSTPNGDLPIAYLNRHALELFLKSAIVIIHRSLKLNFGDRSCDSEPALRTKKGDWKLLRREHSTLALYDYFLALVRGNHQVLSGYATDWSNPPAELHDWIRQIDEWDASSTFFRYPNSKTTTWRHSSINEITATTLRDAPPIKAFVLSDRNEGVVGVYRHDEAGLDDVQNLLRKATELFEGVCFGLRLELAGGR